MDTCVMPDVELDADALEAEILRFAARANALQCRWLELIGEFDRRELWQRDLLGSTAQWVAWRCAMGPRAAREHVRVARRLRELPAVHAAFATGELSYSKVRALTRIATDATEEELVEFARHATAAQVARIARHVERASRPSRAAEGDGADTLYADWTDGGRLEVRASFSAETGAVVLAHLEAGAEALARDELRACGESGPAGPLSIADPSAAAPRDATAPDRCGKSGPAGPRRLTSKPHRRARCLVEALRGERRRAADPEEFLVVVHADWFTVAGEDGGLGVIEGGPALDAAIIRQLCCDQPMQMLVRDSKGNPLFLGRTTRAVNRHMRRALRVRDGDRCAHPGCDAREGVQAHHVVWWRNGGRTDITNLVLLCRRHHRAVHTGELRVEADGTGAFRFSIGDRVLEAVAAAPLTVDDMHAELEQTRAPWSGTGEWLDADHTLSAVHSLGAHRWP